MDRLFSELSLPSVDYGINVNMGRGVLLWIMFPIRNNFLLGLKISNTNNLTHSGNYTSFLRTSLKIFYVQLPTNSN